MALICKAWGIPGTRYPTELTFGLDSRPAVGGRTQDVVRNGIIESNLTPLDCLHVFEAQDDLTARRYFAGLVRDGVPHDSQTFESRTVVNPGKVWRFRGIPHYISLQETRVGLPQTLLRQACRSPELREISNRLSQLMAQYHGAYRMSATDPTRQTQVRRDMDEVEKEVAKIVAQAMAATAMADEAWRAHGMEPPDRGFAVLTDNDPPPAAQANGLVPSGHPSEES